MLPFKTTNKGDRLYKKDTPSGHREWTRESSGLRDAADASPGGSLFRTGGHHFCQTLPTALEAAAVHWSTAGPGSRLPSYRPTCPAVSRPKAGTNEANRLPTANPPLCLPGPPGSVAGTCRNGSSGVLCQRTERPAFEVARLSGVHLANPRTQVGCLKRRGQTSLRLSYLCSPACNRDRRWSLG